MLEAGTSRESGDETWFLAAEPDVVLREPSLLSGAGAPGGQGQARRTPSGSPARPVFPSLLSCGRALKSP